MPASARPASVQRERIHSVSQSGNARDRSSGSSPIVGFLPVSISRASDCTAAMSLRGDAGRPSAPAIPVSATSTPSSPTRTFSAFNSPCAMPAACACASPFNTPRSISTVRDNGTGPLLPIQARRVVPGTKDRV